MKTIMLSLVLLIGIPFSGNSEQVIIQSQNTYSGNDCDVEALFFYEGALASGKSQGRANEIFSDNYWSCLDEGGDSELTVYVGF